MSNAKKCDRCGKFYEKHEGTNVDWSDYKFNSLSIFSTVGLVRLVSKDYDLCPECMKYLVEWLKEQKDE